MDTTPVSPATRIGTAAWAAAVAVAVAVAGLAQAGDWVEPKRADAAPAASRSAAPWIHPSMDADTRSKLAAALARAAARVEASPECAGLFAELGADGADVLAGSFYFPAPLRQMESTCRRATAYTYVGKETTFLCRGFASLTDERAALVIIHEALHHAGLAESPYELSAQTSAAINDMVRKACGAQQARQPASAG